MAVMAQRRVVVTGMGAVTPFGVTVDALWGGLVEGRSAVSTIKLFDTTEFASRIGGECSDFDATRHIDRRVVKRLDRYAQFALVAANEAFASAGLDMTTEDPRRVSVIFGTGIGGLHELEEQHGRLMIKGPGKVSAFTIPKLMVNAASGNISIAYGAKGESIAVSTACASATNAMGEALRLIRTNRADVVFTGGSEAAVTPLSVAAFASMKALSTRNDDPEAASRPFERDRDGFVIGEGAGALMFEELERAKKRGANILAEIVGFGATCDAEHITQPSDTGEGAAEAMRLAMADAGMNPADIDYINAHGTSTPLGDIAETLAIKQVFGASASKLVVSSTKSALGHSLGASGGIEMIACIQAMLQSTIPPTINLDHADDACDLNYCPNTAQDRRVQTVMNNSFGFGGHNACLVARCFN